MKEIKISVIMPIYNGEKYLIGALRSVLDQTFKDFELILINDGSTDKTPEIINVVKDKRVVVINNKKNLGVAKSLNIGLKKARGEYIARCDSDDLNKLDRFQKQVDFLDKNIDYILVGSQFEIINENGEKIGSSSLPETDNEIRKNIFIRNPIAHPSVVYRKKEILRLGGYREFFNGAEDYDLFFRLLRVGKVCNFKETLIKRRWHKEVVTKRNHFKIEFIALIARLVNFLKV